MGTTTTTTTKGGVGYSLQTNKGRKAIISKVNALVTGSSRLVG